VDNAGTYKLDRARIVFEQFEDETVLVNTETGYYYSLSPSGSEILRLLEEGCPAESLVHALFGNSYSISHPTGLIESFVKRLKSEGILVDRASDHPFDTNGERRAPLYADGADFPPPALDRFDDVRDLLLIDPIHQVDAEYGWPKAKVNG
jgi:hypothetical protein